MKNKLARYFPRSLFGRNLLLIIGLIILAETALVIVVRQEVQIPRIAHAQDYAHQQALATRALLSNLDAPAREAWQRQHPAPQLSNTSAHFPLPYRLAPDYIAALQARLGKDYALHWQMAGEQPALWLQIQYDKQDYWLLLDTSALQTKLTPLILMVALAAGGLALCGAALIQRRINAPLQQLALAAHALGKGQLLSFTPPASALPLPQEIAQLAQALQQMAQDLQDAESERALMLAGVSHDLRTPLTKLRLASEILHSSVVEQADIELLQGMARNIKAADEVIAQFIAYARFGSDEVVERIDICALLRELAQETPLLQLDLAVDSLPLPCRPIALRRAVQNLLDNALRYAAPKQIGDVRLALTIEQPNQLRLSVADRGPGIPSAQRLRVRQPFTRLQDTRTQAQDAQGAHTGVGLGLAIVERIARLHHGSLQLQEREGGGLLASLLLPFKR